MQKVRGLGYDFVSELVNTYKNDVFAGITCLRLTKVMEFEHKLTLRQAKVS